MGRYVIGLDFGTNSMRTLIVDVRNGRELASFVADYPTGDAGVVLDDTDADLARQNPADYLEAISAESPKPSSMRRRMENSPPRALLGSV